MKDGRPKRGMDRDLALKVLALCSAVKDALDDLLETMFIIYQPKDWYGPDGASVTLTVKAMNVALYQWQHKDAGGTWRNSSATGYNTESITFTMGEAYVTRIRRCKLTDAEGNVLYTDIVHTYIEEGG